MTDRDRLIELLKQASEKCNTQKQCIECNGYGRGKDCFKYVIADYLLANGVIVPKYKVGDTVWYITGIHNTIVKSAIVDEIIINCNGVSDLFVTSDTCSFENSVDIFYPTKEEAEQALAERSKNNA